MIVGEVSNQFVKPDTCKTYHIDVNCKTYHDWSINFKNCLDFELILHFLSKCKKNDNLPGPASSAAWIAADTSPHLKQ